ALSAPHGLSLSGTSGTVARAWLAEPQPADGYASAAVFLNTLIPAEVFVRGAGLSGAAPSYYAVVIARGVEVQCVRVHKGKATVLGTLKSSGYVSEKWVRVTLNAKGKKLQAQVIRLDTAEYLTAAGQWQAAPAWALEVSDDTLADGGKVGVGRAARY